MTVRVSVSSLLLLHSKLPLLLICHHWQRRIEQRGTILSHPLSDSGDVCGGRKHMQSHECHACHPLCFKVYGNTCSCSPPATARKAQKRHSLAKAGLITCLEIALVDRHCLMHQAEQDGEKDGVSDGVHSLSSPVTGTTGTTRQVCRHRFIRGMGTDSPRTHLLHCEHLMLASEAVLGILLSRCLHQRSLSLLLLKPKPNKEKIN